jgi:hypothetical protein
VGKEAVIQGSVDAEACDQLEIAYDVTRVFEECDLRAGDVVGLCPRGEVAEAIELP